MELLDGHVVQMATGEGKTLAGALAAAGYALQGRPVHVMSVNDYLARRDAEWMGPVYELLGVSVGWVDQTSTAGRAARGLRERTSRTARSARSASTCCGTGCAPTSRRWSAASRTWCWSTRPTRCSSTRPRCRWCWPGRPTTRPADPEVAKIVRTLRPGAHYERDEDGRNAWLTARGAKVVEKALGGVDLYSGEHSDRLAAVNAALHAHALLERDVDYIVRDGKVAPDQLLARPDRAAAALAGRAAGRGRGQGAAAADGERRGARLDQRAGPDQPVPDGVRDDRHGVGGRRAAAGVLRAARSR